MQSLDEQTINCPYCGELIHVLVDCSVAEQSYIEDCQVCCRPIECVVSVDDDGVVDLRVFSEND